MSPAATQPFPASELERRVQLLPIEDLHPHPKNPHGELTKGDPGIVELLAQIEAQGQKVPCLVRPEFDDKSGGWQIVFGHRRTFVAALRGEKLVPCLVEELTDEQADILVLQENASHAPPDPFLEAELIEDLRSRPGWNLRHVANQLGKSLLWVARRANLKKGLSPKVKKLYESGKLKSWPIEWLEDVSRLSIEAQDELAPELEWTNTREVLEGKIGLRICQLGTAPWKLDDATLVAAAGACTTCPKTSARSPGLFDEAELDPADPKALKKALCLDRACYEKKRAAELRGRVADLKAEHGDAVVVQDYAHKAPKGVKAVRDYQVTPAKKGEKGAVPAIRPGSKKVEYVKLDKDPRSSSKKKTKAEKGSKEDLESSKKEIAERRKEWVTDELVRLVGKVKAPKSSVIEGLIFAFGVMSPEYQGRDWKANEEKILRQRRELFEFATRPFSPDDWAKKIWDRVLACLLEEISYGNDRCLAPWVAELLEIDVGDVEAKAIAAIADPDWWPKPAAEASTGLVEKQVATIEKSGFHSGKKPKKGRPGVCRGCGCTEANACEGGCSWADSSMTLCTSCDGDQPRGKATPAPAEAGKKKRSTSPRARNLRGGR